jgi:hypothetical protein
MKVQQLIRQLVGGIIMRNIIVSNEKAKKPDNSGSMKSDTKEETYPKMPSDFQCFVCGTRFATNEGRIQHLEKEAHASLYATGSPNDSEV